MRVKTSISLSSEILAAVSNFTSDGTRSLFVEKALWNYVQLLHRQEKNQRDLEKINSTTDYLNKEALDALSYQELI